MLYEWSSLVSALPWRSNQVMLHEPRMPPHQYVLRDWCEGEHRKLYEALRFILDTHAESYRGYFRAYQSPMRYLEVGMGPGDFRYWRTMNKTAGGTKHFLNRCRLDSVEPPRRVDQGARPIPLRDWGASQPYWPRDSGYGEWRREGGVWVFHRQAEHASPVLTDARPSGGATRAGHVARR